MSDDSSSPGATGPDLAFALSLEFMARALFDDEQRRAIREKLCAAVEARYAGRVSHDDDREMQVAIAGLEAIWSTPTSPKPDEGR